MLAMGEVDGVGGTMSRAREVGKSDLVGRRGAILVAFCDSGKQLFLSTAMKRRVHHLDGVATSR